MLLSPSNRKDCAAMPSNTENLVRNESMKNKGDLSDSNKGDTADLKMVHSKKKIDYSMSYWLLMICLLLIIVASAVFVFFTKGLGNKRQVFNIFNLLQYDICLTG